MTPPYPIHEVCAAGQSIYNCEFDRHPLLADALEDAVYIDAGILAHCRELVEHETKVLPPPVSLRHIAC